MIFREWGIYHRALLIRNIQKYGPKRKCGFPKGADNPKKKFSILLNASKLFYLFQVWIYLKLEKEIWNEYEHNAKGIIDSDVFVILYIIILFRN